ncbi:MAG: hypothetical protein ACO36I_09990 [Candidatus Latescibacterota bacterium]
MVRNPYDRYISLWWSTCMREKGNQSPRSAAVIIKNNQTFFVENT